MLDGMGELDAAARHPGMIATLHLQPSVLRDLLASLFDFPVTQEDEARKNERLRTRPAFRQATIDQQLVGSHLRHQRTSPVKVDTVSSCGRVWPCWPGAYQR